MPPQRVIDVESVPAGALVGVLVNDVPICLARTPDGAFYAIEDTCSHEGAVLSDGEIVGSEVECPWHGSRFDLATGRATCLPAVEPIRAFPVVIEDGAVFLDVDGQSEATASN